MASPKVAGGAASAALKSVLDSPEIGRLIEELEATRWTGRPGYPVRTMVGLSLAKSLYAIPTWTKVVALVGEHWKLQRVLGCEGNPPTQWAAYRWAAKLKENGDMLERCIDSVVAGLKEKLPNYGTDLAIDASDLPAYANGQRLRLKGGPERNWHTDPDASWGHRSAVSTRRGGGFYGFKLQMAGCTKTGLPVAWSVETAKANESHVRRSTARHGSSAEARWSATCAMDKAYDIGRVYDECAERDCEADRPAAGDGRVKRGEHRPPACSARRLDVRRS